MINCTGVASMNETYVIHSMGHVLTIGRDEPKNMRIMMTAEAMPLRMKLSVRSRISFCLADRSVSTNSFSVFVSMTVYPASVMVLLSSGSVTSVGLYLMVTRSVARLTATSMTPSFPLRASSMRLTHEAQ